MREKGCEERGPKAHSKTSDFGTPMIQVLFSGLSIGESSTSSVQTLPPTPFPKICSGELMWSCTCKPSQNIFSGAIFI